VANSLDNTTIVGEGISGAAHEHTIQTFNAEADINIFCWTEAQRFYHKTYYINGSSIERLIKQKTKMPVYQAAGIYYKYLHDFEYAEKRQYRDLYWFDQEILSKYKGTAVHLWSFQNIYMFKHGITMTQPITKVFQTYPEKSELPTLNHLSLEDNKKLAEIVLKYLKNTCYYKTSLKKAYHELPTVKELRS